MNTQINRLFLKVLVNSLNTQQIAYLGERLDRTFDIARESGIGPRMPIPRQTAAQTLLYRFSSDEEVVNLFSYLIEHEGKRFYNRDLVIWGKDEFISLLRKNKWIFDQDLKQFLIDPFYEREINFLKSIRVIDLRTEIQIDDIIQRITEISETMGIQDLEWRVTLRLYDLDPKIGALIRKIIQLLLARQNLSMFAGELFICLKELAINASKANYKLLFEKYATRRDGINAEHDYKRFLELFKDEIAEYGNRRLLELARKEDRYINITFQSSIDSIEVWVTNNQNISAIEKKQILKKLGMGRMLQDSFDSDDEYVEGAGLGLAIILKTLEKYASDEHPLKVVFYPDSIKIGFSLRRSDLVAGQA